MAYLLCIMAGFLTGFVLAAVLGASAEADYRERLRRQIAEEALEHDYGTLDSPLTGGAGVPACPPNRPL
jgi:hypothetical protein